MLNPLHLRTLTSVLQTGSFALAARQLGYTPSAVSQQIATLERAVRLPLFEREAHRIRPTPAATYVAGRGQEVLGALGTLEEDLRSLAEGTSGTVRLGSFPTASEHLVPAALASLAVTHPTVEVLLDEGEPGELAPAIHDGDLDIALVYRYTRVPVRYPRGSTVVPLLREELVLLLPAGHPSAGTETVALEDLEDAVWVTTRERTEGATCLRRMCADAGFVPKVSFRSNDYDVIRRFVRAGLGIALIPGMGHVEDPGVVTARVSGTPVHRHVGILRRTDVGNPAVSGVVAALRTSAASVHDRGHLVVPRRAGSD